MTKEKEAAETSYRWHLHPLRVRYQETDQMGVVFYGNYANWFEVGRTEIVRALGTPYTAVEKEGLLLPVVDLDCAYLSPARYDDNVLVCTRIEQLSPVRMSFRSQVRLVGEGETYPVFWDGPEPPGKLLVHGGTRHVWVNREWKPARLDKALPELYAMLRTTVSRL